MLVEFSVGNFRSFKERVTLSMVAADIASQPPELDARNTFAAAERLRLLSSAAIYGANASGKSNLIAALAFMRGFILTSTQATQPSAPIDVEPFRLSTATEGQPSHFELVFLAGGTQYRYGFEVTPQQVTAEWLYELGGQRERTLFTRDAEAIRVNPRTFREGRGLEARTRPNALFLSVAAQFNSAIAERLLSWLSALALESGIGEADDFMLAVGLNRDVPYRAAIEALVRRLDIGIADIRFVSGPAVVPEHAPPAVRQGLQRLLDEMRKRVGELEQISVQTTHTRYGADGEPHDDVAFDLMQHESEGTQRLFALAGPLIRTLDAGGVLVVDEFDARLHPNLVTELVRLFHDPATNPQHAQLIFTTHNTNLLSAKLLRRDQVWFVEKSRQGSSDLYSLVEFRIDGKVVRNDASFEKDYVLGRYGAVPFIGDLSELREVLGEPAPGR